MSRRPAPPTAAPWFTEPAPIPSRSRSRSRRQARRHAALGTLWMLVAITIGVVAWAGPSVGFGRTDGAGGESMAPVDVAGVEATIRPAVDPASQGPPATGLHPGLQQAFDRARGDAAAAGHNLVMTSGFRTAAEQQQLLDAEILKRGSHEEAARWVFTPERSMHVKGLAIDVGDGPAADWLLVHGAAYGLCQTMTWEWWHFEWRTEWENTQRCPEPARSLEAMTY